MKVLITGGLGGIAMGGLNSYLARDYDVRISHYRLPEGECEHEFVKRDMRYLIYVLTIICSGGRKRIAILLGDFFRKLKI